MTTVTRARHKLRMWKAPQSVWGDRARTAILDSLAHSEAAGLTPEATAKAIDDAFRHIRCRSLGLAGAEAKYVTHGAAFASQVDAKRDAEESAKTWNDAHPVGTPVRYWTGCREGAGKVSVTRSEAQPMSDSHASVWAVGEASCISLSHVEVVG